MNKRLLGWLFIFALVGVIVYLYKKGAVKLPDFLNINPSPGNALLSDSPIAGPSVPVSLYPTDGAPIPGISSSPDYVTPRAPTLPPSGRPNYYTP